MNKMAVQRPQKWHDNLKETWKLKSAAVKEYQRTLWICKS